MPLSTRLAPALRRLAPRARLVRDERGVVAIEFAILALPFLVFLLAIIETSIVLFAGQALDAAVTKSARLIRTGQAQSQFTNENPEVNKGAFRALVCSDVKPLLGNDCPGLTVDVTTLDDFSGLKTLSSPIDATGNVKTDFAGGYDPGGGGEIVAVRAFYEWPLFVKLFGLDLSNVGSGNRLLTAVSVFRNEPF